MTLYQVLRHRLVTDGYNTRYFTREFYDIYVRANWKVTNNCRNGIVDFVEWNGITVHAPYIPVYGTNFYNKNGNTYCHFLEIHNQVVKNEFENRFGKAA